MKITLLGTGTSQGVPVVGCNCPVCLSDDPRDNRLRTAAFVEVDGTNILIDAGPDLRLQLLHNKITHVDAILVTHEHKDHLAGLDDIRPIFFMMKTPMNVFGLHRVLNVVRKDFDYAFKANPYPGAPSFNLHSVRDDSFFVNGVEITPIHVRHLTLPILGYRIGTLGYITDASFIAETELNKLKGLDVLVINALRLEEHYSHFNLDQALNVIDKLNPKRAYLTHMSHRMGKYTDLSKRLPDNVFAGYDGLNITVE
ncbi:MAG: MBL fold metallo-hydrolase [Bacteroidales bacterium]|nr:MBL fold metallo-hydrolase [Bacteroidales bacterium]